MYFDEKNETNVTAETSSAAPAKIAASEHVDELGAAPGAPIASSSETPVSPAPVRERREVIVTADDSTVLFGDGLPPVTYGNVRALVVGLLNSPAGQAILAKSFDDGVEGIDAHFAQLIDAAKAEILAHVSELVKPIVAASVPAPEKPAIPAAPPHVLAAGDPVRVYNDAARKTFYTGTVVALHDGGHAADVKLNELGGATTTVRLDALEYDDRA